MGKLIIYTGAMKSGKSTKLIEQYNKTLKKCKKTGMFKPRIDTRISKTKVIARNVEQQIQANLLNSIEDLLYYKKIYTNFFIDEFQFLDGDINIIKYLMNKDKNFFVAGLNLTAEQKPFGKMGELMCFADKIYILEGTCDFCHKENVGKFTYFEGTKNQDILIDNEDKYKCVCSKCYEEHKNNIANKLK